MSAYNLSLCRRSVSGIGRLERNIAVVELPCCIVGMKPWSRRAFAAVFGGVLGCRTVLAVGRLTVTGRMFEEVELPEHELEEVGKDG